MPSVVLYDWPFFALAGGVAGMAILLAWPRPSDALPRWRDPAWLVCLMLPMYMLHQFEEHGFNLFAQRYHFIEELCASLGYRELSRCPASPSFVLAVNLGVWIPGVLAILYRRRNIMVGACAMGIPLVNAAVHVGVGIAQHHYNSGLLTAVGLFVPICAWTLFQLWRSGTLDKARLASVLASVVAVHLVLIASVLAHGADLLAEAPLLLINFLDGFIPPGFAALVRASPKRSIPGDPASLR